MDGGGTGKKSQREIQLYREQLILYYVDYSKSILMKLMHKILYVTLLF